MPGHNRQHREQWHGYAQDDRQTMNTPDKDADTQAHEYLPQALAKARQPVTHGKHAGKGRVLTDMCDQMAAGFSRPYRDMVAGRLMLLLAQQVEVDQEGRAILPA